ncbi:hypothetical protein AAFC00_000092 [Neodothiora populina]|uniref:Amidohydrolase-related domain-containing protein n=1 Tax=Neodothiora populina TaxID=2781224 RepID=A0ABR3P1Q4_9PEZI
MAPTVITDSHVHLWPQSAANPAGHSWMKPGHMLTKEHILSDYRKACSGLSSSPSSSDDESVVKGIVYVETDRRLAANKHNRPIQEWAAEPTEEVRFLRSIIKGDYGEPDSQMLLGLVLWAPLDQGLAAFESWLSHAEEVAGAETWARVKGFRMLLQAIHDQTEFENLVFSDDFIAILKSLGTRSKRFSFDVGVDQHSGGAWQLEAMVKVIEKVNDGAREEERVTFVLDHLCKPDLTQAPSAPSPEDFSRWKTCIEQFSSFPNVYMKLSGAFSELGDSISSASQTTTSTTDDDDSTPTTTATQIATSTSPWLDHVFDHFTTQRVMFGSDWPVCNIRGPAGEKSWPVWRDVVSAAMESRGFSEDEKAQVWRGAVARAYSL